MLVFGSLYALSASAFEHYTAHGGPVKGLALSPDGRWLVSTSFDYTAVLWSVPDFSERLTLVGHEAAVNTAAFSPDGRYLVTAGDDRTLRVWNMDQLLAEAPADGHRGGPTGHGEGHVCMWAKPPEAFEPSAITLAVLGDWVPMGISMASRENLSSNSLDNTIRVLDVHPTEYYLLEIEAAGIRHGFGHGQIRIWGDDGRLQAIASQSVVARERKQRRPPPPHDEVS